MAAHSHILTIAEPCPVTGQPCAVAQALLDTLSLAMSRAIDVVGPDLSLTGVVETRACGRTCRLHWSGSGREITVDATLSGTGPRLCAERCPERLS